MSYMHLRAAERSAARSAPNPIPGLRVTCLSRGQVFFFPGGTPELAMILARAALLDGALEHPRTEVAYGEKDGPVWKEIQVIKAAEGGG